MLFGVFYSKSDDGGQSQATHQVPAKEAEAGNSSNGYSTKIESEGSYINIYALRDIGITGEPKGIVSSNMYRPAYLVPTNWFCGMIRLWNSNQMELRCWKPKLMATNAYPASLNWQAMWLQIAQSSGEFSPMPGDKSFFDGAEFKGSAVTRDKICEFTLNDLFDLKAKGDYKLTVWAKIYKRSATNDNIYNRIDLAPASTTIHVN